MEKEREVDEGDKWRGRNEGKSREKVREAKGKEGEKRKGRK